MGHSKELTFHGENLHLDESDFARASVFVPVRVIMFEIIKDFTSMQQKKSRS